MLCESGVIASTRWHTACSSIDSNPLRITRRHSKGDLGKECLRYTIHDMYSFKQRLNVNTRPMNRNPIMKLILVSFIQKFDKLLTKRPSRLE